MIVFLHALKKGSYHKRQISNPQTPLPPMFKTAKFLIRQRRYQPNLTLPKHWQLALMDSGGYSVGGFEIWRLCVPPLKNRILFLNMSLRRYILYSLSFRDTPYSSWELNLE